MDRVREVNQNDISEWQDIYSTKENAERWTQWHDDDLVSKFCALMPIRAQVLDVATGAGFGPKLISERRPDIIWHGCDFSPNAIAYLRKHSPVRWADIRVADILKGLPYKDGEFQVVMCTELLEHLEDPKTALKELARVCHELLIITVPFKNAVDSPYHVWSVEKIDMLRWLEPYGYPSAFLARADRQLVGVCHLK